MPQLATRFSRNTNVLRSGSPLGEEQGVRLISVQ